MRIVVDAMGGDHAPQAPVEGAVQAVRDAEATTRDDPISLVLVGREGEVAGILDGLGAAQLPIEVVHAEHAIAMDELNPAEAVRGQEDASIVRCMLMLRQEEAQAVVTMGHTGAALAAGLLRLGRIPGVRRPALAAPFPTVNRRPCVLIDVGANADVRPEDLFQFAVMGSAYARGIFGIDRPRVGLVSIGEEARKGNQRVQEAWPLLEQSDLNFVGNLEGRDVPGGAADVAVVDGFTGNVMIKLAEGLSGLLQQVLRDAATGDPLGMLGGLLLKPSLRRARQQIDYRAYGGASLLGVRGVVVIGHGRSDPAAVRTAIGVAERGVRSGLVRAIEVGVSA